MPKAQELVANIKINASANVGAAASAINQLSSMISGLTGQTVEFGKESIDTYRDYEAQMTEAEVALSTLYGRDTKKLADVMDQLDEAAQQWAASTIFHTDDVSEAINNAAHAGWNLDEILLGIPAAMNLAQAGGLELSDSVDYITKATNAAGVGFDELTGFVDQWVFAANSSATDVGEMGEAMMTLGSTMNFADSTEELFVLIAALANAGTTGSEAGTMLRNSILRLAAPTAMAQKQLLELGVTEEEISEIMGDDTEVVAELFSQIGFSAYDAEGNLKPVLQMFEELNEAMSFMSEEEANEALRTIFGTRTITGALNLMSAAENAWDGLWEKMTGKEYEGYSGYASVEMMDTLGGAIEIFESKIEALKVSVGEALAPGVENVLGFLGGFIDILNNADESAINAVVAGVTALVGVGSVTMGAGTVLSAIVKLMNPTVTTAAGIMATVAAVSTLIGVMNQVQENNFESNFGTMNLEMGTMTAYLGQMSAMFYLNTEQVKQFRDTLQGAIDSYTEASSAFSSTLLTDMLTKNGELSGDDLAALIGIGDKMYDAISQAITTRADTDTQFWANLLTGTEGEGYLDSIVGIIEQTAEGAKERLAVLGKELRSALASGFADGSISLDERQAIMDIVSEMNEIAAQTQELEMRTQQKMWLWQAQNASWDEVSQIAGSASEEMNAELANWEETYMGSRAMLEASYEMNGETVPQEQLDALDAQYEAQRLKIAEGYDEFLMTLLETTMSGSEFGDSYSALMSYASGFLTGMGPMMGDFSGISTGDWKDMGEAFSQFISTFGGSADLYDRISGYATTNPELAQRLAALMVAAEQTSGYMMGGSNYSANMGVTGGYGGLFGYGAFSDGNIRNYGYEIGPEMVYGTKDWGTDFRFGKGNPADLIGIEDSSPTKLKDWFTDDKFGKGNLSDLEGIEFEVEVTGNTDQLAAAIDALSGKTVYVDVVSNTVSTDDGTGSKDSATKNTTSSSKVKKYALGGRATTASIFGEAGPEWAIPEAHTARTYSLLSAAISATGFSGEMGGTLVYSPTINAVDANGVETVLADDKRRLERMLSDRRLREEAVRYQ